MKNKEHKEKEKKKPTQEGQPENIESQENGGKGESKDKNSKSKNEAEEWKQKFEEANDKYLRLYSDFDNYRKRTLKEKLELLKNASEDLIVELLPIIDDFERALQAFEQHNVGDEAVKGTELIYNKLLRTLEQKGLKPMDSMGKEFDTDFHEA
ncbi:MAG TPA: nucleotide exchange factor GrpE, partial [Bacteroidales bacterium]